MPVLGGGRLGRRSHGRSSDPSASRSRSGRGCFGSDHRPHDAGTTGLSGGDGLAARPGRGGGRRTRTGRSAPVVFDESGRGRQTGLDGTHFDYAPGAFTVTLLGEAAIPCPSVEQQLTFREGYSPRPVDHHDLALLRRFGRPPIAVDDVGQALVELGSADESGLEAAAVGTELLPCPLALIVVRADDQVLFGLDRRRHLWELPGGIIEAGESDTTAAGTIVRTSREHLDLCWADLDRPPEPVAALDLAIARWTARARPLRPGPGPTAQTVNTIR